MTVLVLAIGGNIPVRRRFWRRLGVVLKYLMLGSSTIGGYLEGIVPMNTVIEILRLFHRLFVLVVPISARFKGEA